MSLEPLTRRGWQGNAAFWAALLSAEPYLRRALRGVRPVPPVTPDDLFQEALVRLSERAARQGGLADPAAGVPLELWIAKAARNAALDQVRRCPSTPEPLVAEPALVGDPEAACDLARRVRPARLDDPTLPPVWRLVWLALEAPTTLGPDHVVSAAVRRHETHGLARPPEETWERLVTWRDANAANPKSTAARLELAWVLRTRDRIDATRWADRRPNDAARARDLVRTWHRRAEERLSAG